MRGTLGIAALLAALALTAGCNKGSGAGEGTGRDVAGTQPADTSQVPNNPPPAPGGASATEQHIEVNNPMDHAMIVSTTVGGQQQVLGTVAGKAKGSFLVQAPPGTPIQLTAQDSAKTHQVQGTVTATNGLAGWVIK